MAIASDPEEETTKDSSLSLSVVAEESVSDSRPVSPTAEPTPPTAAAAVPVAAAAALVTEDSNSASSNEESKRTQVTGTKRKLSEITSTEHKSATVDKIHFMTCIIR